MSKLVFTSSTQNELLLIKSYISRDSIFYANKTVSEISLKIQNLVLFPYMGRKIPEYDTEHLREIFYKSYRIFYEIESNNINILHIFHHSRNISNLSF